MELPLIQHFDRRGQYEMALSKIDEAIEHTPTVIDLYSVKVCFDHLLENFAWVDQIMLFLDNTLHNKFVYTCYDIIRGVLSFQYGVALSKIVEPSVVDLYSVKVCFYH